MHLWKLSLGIRQTRVSLIAPSCGPPHLTLPVSRSLTALTCTACIYVDHTMGASPWLVGPSEACGAQASLQIPTSCGVGGEPEILSEASAFNC